MIVSEKFLHRRAYMLTKEKECQNCYLVPLLQEYDTTILKCPFSFMEFGCNKFLKTYEKILRKEKRRDWDTLETLICQSHGKQDENEECVNFDDINISPELLDELINGTCESIEEEKNTRKESWIKHQVEAMDKKINIKDTYDKDNIIEILHAFESKEKTYKRYAIQAIGEISKTHGFEFINTVGAMVELEDVFEKALEENDVLTLITISETYFLIALSGGAKTLLESKILKTMMSYIRDGNSQLKIKRRFSLVIGICMSFLL